MFPHDVVVNAEFVLKTIEQYIHPVGSLYLTVDPTNPEKLFAGTQWVAWGSGRVPVGVNSSDSRFYSVEYTGGSSTVMLNIGEIPVHTHSFTYTGNTYAAATHKHNVTDLGHQHDVVGNDAWRNAKNGTGADVNGREWVKTEFAAANISEKFAGGAAHQFYIPPTETASVGRGQSHNNLQPYITCYMWKRVA